MISLHDLVDERLDKDLSPAGNDKQRVALCRKLMAQWPEDYFYQAAGLRKIVAILGDEAFDDLLNALAHPNEILHEVAVSLAADFPGTGTEKWVDLLANANSRKLAGILDVLGHRQDPQALTAVSKYLEHEDPVVRQAAKRAVSKLDESVEQRR
jgi:HEAT repeat protein